MYLVNKNYIKIDTLDIFSALANGKDKKMIKFFQKIQGLVFDNKNPNYRYGAYDREGIYISIKDLINKNIFDISKLEIKSESIMNASMIALYNDDLETAQKLSFYFEKPSYAKEELGELADYVLENSMSISEYLYGISECFIYKEKKNVIETGYIFDESIIEHKEKKRKQ